MKRDSLTPHPDPRRIGKHVGEILDMIRGAGGTGIKVYQGRHLRIVFYVGSHEITAHAPCTPRSEGDQLSFARQQIMRSIERALGRRP